MGEFDEIELKIKAILESVAQEDDEAGGLRTGEWTKRINFELSKLGHEKGFGVSTRGCKGAETGEWLFDLIWADGEGDPWIFREMPLVMESELSDLDAGKIWWDFEKLLVVRSKYRVFIFHQRTRDEVDNLLDDFENAIHDFKSTQVGDRYFLAGFRWDDANFKFRSVVV